MSRHRMVIRAICFWNLLPLLTSWKNFFISLAFNTANIAIYHCPNDHSPYGFKYLKYLKILCNTIFLTCTLKNLVCRSRFIHIMQWLKLSVIKSKTEMTIYIFLLCNYRFCQLCWAYNSNFSALLLKIMKTSLEYRKWSTNILELFLYIIY